MDSSAGGKIKFLPHHKQQSLCTTRPLYRQGRKLTAVKVYTVNDESVHLLIHGVPSIGLLSEVSMLCERYGRVKSVKLVDQYSTDQEEFTNVYHVQFERIQSARFAKKILDNRSFFGGVLHVCYAPELETINQTKLKLINRKREIAKRSKHTSNEVNPISSVVTNIMVEKSIGTADEDQISLESIPASNVDNSAITRVTMCFPSTSHSTITSHQALPSLEPIMPNISDFNINTQPPGPAIIPQQISAEDSLTSQNIDLKKDETFQAVNKNFYNPRKRPYSSFVSDTQPFASAIVSQQINCSESQKIPETKKHKVLKTRKTADSNFSSLQEQPKFVDKTQLTGCPELSIQDADKKLVWKEGSLKRPHSRTNHSTKPGTSLQVNNPKPSKSEEVGKIVTCNSNAAIINNSSNPSKQLIVGPIRFIPRSVAIKKNKM